MRMNTSLRRRLGCALVAVCVLELSPVALASPISPSPTPSTVLAQSQDQQRTSSRTNFRANRGLVKLGIGAVVLGIAGVGWIYRKVTGDNDD
jgi:hypothetical protein